MMSAAPSGSSTPQERRARRAERQGRRDRDLILGVPARFMRPRLVLLAASAALAAFGLLMVYSSSSVEALTGMGDSLYYIKRQALFALAGFVAAALVVKVGYRTLSGVLLKPLWALTLALLLLIWVPGLGSNALGASRWVELGPVTLQPSEFAKITVILTAAQLFEERFGAGRLDDHEFVKLLGMGVGLPVLLILAQPDKGSSLVIVTSLLVMAYLAGASGRLVMGLLALGVVGFFGLSLVQSYSRARILTLFDPWKYADTTGFQLIRGFYAFGSGGLTGVGIGMSRQKYGYLPMAYNDFIFAVVGEECGLVGTLGVIVGFVAIAWAGLRIARYAPDMAGQLIALGCTSLLVIQMLLNVSGVIGVFPLSGKPIPFLSYGGSSIMSSAMLVGLMLSVSKESRLSLTEYDERRQGLRVVGKTGDDLAPVEHVGQATPRSRREQVVNGPQLRLVDRRAPRAATPREPGALPGRRRIDLGPSALDRLRRDDAGPRVRGGRNDGRRS